VHAVLTQQGPISVSNLEVRAYEGIRISIIFSVREDMALLEEVAYGTYRLFKPNTPSYTEVEIHDLPKPQEGSPKRISNLPMRSEIAYNLVPKKITIKRLLVANRGSFDGSDTDSQDAPGYAKEAS
jgi:hypothetical protein